MLPPHGKKEFGLSLLRFMQRLQRKVFIVFFLLSAFGLVSCFNERSPKKPEENTDWISPTEPSLLLENLKKAIVSLNFNNYRRCFATEVFRFRADPTITANNLGLFNNWTWDNETQYFNNLSQASKPVSPNNSLIFSNTRTINLSSDSLELTSDYNLAIYHQDTAFQSVTFTGLLSFQMKRNRQNEWQITSWQDNKTKATPCWTELRQHFFAP
jgi:hypothetical protein